MTSSTQEIAHDFPPFFKVYKDGHVERYQERHDIPAGYDLITGITTKDVEISPETGLSVRIFIPQFNGPDQKFPLVIHYHGGGFCLGSSFDSISNGFLYNLVAKAHVIAISVNFRLAPEHLLPIAYEDSFAGFQWVASHSSGTGPEPTINRHGDFERILLAGESSGATIAHHVAVRAGSIGGLEKGVRIDGLLAVHPFFGGTEEDLIYKYMCPTSRGSADDPNLNPGADPDLAKMAGSRILICLAGVDRMRGPGLTYYEALRKSGWSGKIELFESEGEDHCFHMFSKNENAEELMERLVSFIHQA